MLPRQRRASRARQPCSQGTAGLARRSLPFPWTSAVAIPRLISIQVGLPRQLGRPGATEPSERRWESAIFKEPVSGPVWLGRRNLEGDRQADLAAHGGPDRVVLAYGAEHYATWRRELGLGAVPFGAFGENFTIDGLTEETVCIGDTFAIGEARVQVSQPRGPCWKLARRWERPGFALQVLRTGRTGWYLRVLREGAVVAGMPVTLVERPYPRWTVARATALMRDLPRDPAQMAELAACPLLSDGWVARLRRYAERGSSVADERWVTEQVDNGDGSEGAPIGPQAARDAQTWTR